MSIMSSTICKPLLDVRDSTFSPDLLLKIAEPFKDLHGTHLLGRQALYLDPCEDSPFVSGFVTYEREVYLQKSRLFVSYRYPHLQVFSLGSRYEDELLSALQRNSASTSSRFSFSYRADKDSFIAGCRRVKELILEGDVYQLNLSHEIEFMGDADPFALFKALLEASQVPFSAYICHQGNYFLCLSPERLLHSKNGLLETRPIKGTIPRGLRDVETLLQNPKEKSELLMITDLMRNDLYAISEKGSIHVPHLCEAVVYPHLVHMQSTIRSKLRAGIAPLEALMAVFPGGSITGCPKINAMKFIAELEKRERGIFTGSIGYIAPDGDFDFNIAIRTLVRKGGLWSLQVGSGIVFDSDPEKEYLETLCKAKPFLDVMTR